MKGYGHSLRLRVPNKKAKHKIVLIKIYYKTNHSLNEQILGITM